MMPSDTPAETEGVYTDDVYSKQAVLQPEVAPAGGVAECVEFSDCESGYTSDTQCDTDSVVRGGSGVVGAQAVAEGV